MHQEGGTIMRAIEVLRTQQSECNNCNFQRSKNKAFRKPKRVLKPKSVNINKNEKLQESENVIIDESFALLSSVNKKETSKR